MRKPRRATESDIYHVIARGAGRQASFEDDDVGTRHLNDCNRFQAKRSAQIIAWCLMVNHAHLLIKDEMSAASFFMRTLKSECVQYFNKHHDRIGPLLQGRCKRKPTDTNANLMIAIHYVHESPTKAGIAPIDEYRWSRYVEYSWALVRCKKTERALNIIGSKERLIALHGTSSDRLEPGVREHRGSREPRDDEL